MMIVVTIVVLLLLALGAPLLDQQQAAPPARTSAASETVLAAARRDVEERRYQRAVERLLRLVSDGRADGEALLLLGEAYFADDRADSLSAEGAVDAYANAVALDPELVTAWGRAALERLAVAAVRSERLEIARGAYRRLLTIEQRPEFRARYETQLDEIDLDEGTYQPTPATQFGPTGEIIGPIGPLQMRTNQWFEKGRHTQDPAKAEIYYQKAIDADPVMWQSHLNYGIALARQRKHEQALAPLAEAARRWREAYPDRPEHLRAHLWRLIAFLELGRLADAAQEVALLTTLPDDPWVRLYVLRYLVAIGRAADAVGPLEALARANPENVEVLYALGLAHRAVGRTAEAEATLREAIRVIPDGHRTLTPWVEPLRALLEELRRGRDTRQ
jgi:tetratricopeptide (TPR) repeat protein